MIPNLYIQEKASVTLHFNLTFSDFYKCKINELNEAETQTKMN